MDTGAGVLVAKGNMNFAAFRTRYLDLIRRLTQANPADDNLIAALSREYENLRQQLDRHPTLANDGELLELDTRALAILSQKARDGLRLLLARMRN